MKKSLLALSLVFLAGCIGPNNAFRSLHSWNSRATDSKWWNEVIHVGFWVIPVYEVTLLADVILFNSIEFWGGAHPVSEPEPFRPVSEQR